MRYELKSISLWAFVKVSFFLHLILGFVLGLLYALFFGAIMAILTRLPGMPSSGLEGRNLPVGMMVILFPIMFAILGAFFNTIFGSIIIFVYNAVARMVGGMELDLQPVQETAPAVSTSPGYTPPPVSPSVAPPPPPAYRPPSSEPPAPPSDQPPPGSGI